MTTIGAGDLRGAACVYYSSDYYSSDDEHSDSVARSASSTLSDIASNSVPIKTPEDSWESDVEEPCQSSGVDPNELAKKLQGLSTSSNVIWP
ncbi:MAG: hypothetical protein ACQEP8_06365 [Chlamydiota bacterium]